MENKVKLDIPAKELVALSSSLAICLTEKLTISDICTLRQFLSSLCANLSLYEHQFYYCQKIKNGK